jgi:hypothetical protein
MSCVFVPSASQLTLTRYFGPNQQPHLVVGYRNEVGVDCAGAAHITCAADYQPTVGKDTWNSVMGYADSLQRTQTKIAFLNSVPLGGYEAAMKHALIRFLRLIHVDAKWSVSNRRYKQDIHTKQL